MGRTTTYDKARARILGTLLLLAAFGATLLLNAAPATAVSSPEYELFRLHNRARAEQGLRGLRLDEDLSRVARRHSREMAAAGDIYHTSERVLVRRLEPFQWSHAGENVGIGGSMRRIQAAFMDSPSHRANILNRSYRKVGVGVVHSDGWSWVTVLFIDP